MGIFLCETNTKKLTLQSVVIQLWLVNAVENYEFHVRSQMVKLLLSENFWIFYFNWNNLVLNGDLDFHSDCLIWGSTQSSTDPYMF